MPRLPSGERRSVASLRLIRTAVRLECTAWIRTWFLSHALMMTSPPTLSSLSRVPAETVTVVSVSKPRCCWRGIALRRALANKTVIMPWSFSFHSGGMPAPTSRCSSRLRCGPDHVRGLPEDVQLPPHVRGDLRTQVCVGGIGRDGGTRFGDRPVDDPQVLFNDLE